jgi:hypothetical protein
VSSNFRSSAEAIAIWNIPEYMYSLESKKILVSNVSYYLTPVFSPYEPPR